MGAPRLIRSAALVVAVAASLSLSCKSILGIKDVTLGACDTAADCPAPADTCHRAVCKDFACATIETCNGDICDSGLSEPSNVECGGCDGDLCCGEWTACAKDTECDACATGAATSGCDTDTAYAAAYACEGLHCSAECGKSGICATGYTTSNSTCDGCLTESCCDEWLACLADPDCVVCNAMSCNTNSLLQAYDDCANAHCAGECG